MCDSAGALLDGEVGSGVEGCVAAPEPSWMEWRGPLPRGAWQRRNPHGRRGEVRCRGARSSTGALLDGEAGFGAEGRVAALGPSWMEWWGLVSKDT
jgi:hypothetical protein